jgi:hypothetical protein
MPRVERPGGDEREAEVSQRSAGTAESSQQPAASSIQQPHTLCMQRPISLLGEEDGFWWGQPPSGDSILCELWILLLEGVEGEPQGVCDGGILEMEGESGGSPGRNGPRGGGHSGGRFGAGKPPLGSPGLLLGGLRVFESCAGLSGRDGLVVAVESGRRRGRFLRRHCAWIITLLAC